MKPRLTPRRRQVLILALQGYTMNEAAQQLGVTIETIKQHRIAACSYFGTWNIGVAGAMAVRDGYLSPEELSLIGVAYREESEAA